MPVATSAEKYLMRVFLRVLVFSFLWVCAPAMAWAAQTESVQWEIDPEHSTVGFRIRHIVGYVPGVFSRFSGEVEYDPARPEDSHFYLLIDSSSVHTGVPARDEHLRGPDFLDAERSPKMIFSSRKVLREDEGALVVIGDLTIRDVTAEVRVPLQILASPPILSRTRCPECACLGCRPRCPSIAWISTSARKSGPAWGSWAKRST